MNKPQSYNSRSYNKVPNLQFEIQFIYLAHNPHAHRKPAQKRSPQHFNRAPHNNFTLAILVYPLNFLLATSQLPQSKEKKFRNPALTVHLVDSPIALVMSRTIY